MKTKEIMNNKKKMLERVKLYKQYGYDQIASRNFITKKSAPVKGIVLDVGTGKGHMAVLMAKKARKVVTVDVSSKEQKFAKLNAAAAGVIKKIDFLTCDAGDLPYKDRSFDVVVSVNAFHHLNKPFEVLSEMIRVCADKLVIADFNLKGFEIIRKVHKDEGREHEEQCGDFSIVGQYLKEHGFRVNKYDGHCQAVYVAKRKK